MIAALSAPAPARAGSADEAIKARRSLFALMEFDLTRLAAMAKGDVAYEADQARRHAANLRSLTHYGFEDLFVAGSSNADKPGDTRALPAIWADGAAFGARAQGMRDAMAGLEAVAGDGRAQLGAGVAALGQSCVACHRENRAREF